MPGGRWLHSPGMTGEHVLGPLPGGVKPFLVAHRAGNRIADARRRAARHRTRRSGHPPPSRASRGTAPANRRPAPDPLGPRQLAAPWRRASGSRSCSRRPRRRRSSCSTSRSNCGSPRRRSSRSALISGAVGSRSVPSGGSWGRSPGYPSAGCTRSGRSASSRTSSTASRPSASSLRPRAVARAGERRPLRAIADVAFSRGR